MTQTTSFAISLQYLDKEVSDEVDFLYEHKHESFLPYIFISSCTQQLQTLLQYFSAILLPYCIGQCYRTTHSKIFVSSAIVATSLILSFPPWPTLIHYVI